MSKDRENSSNRALRQLGIVPASFSVFLSSDAENHQRNLWDSVVFAKRGPQKTKKEHFCVFFDEKQRFLMKKREKSVKNRSKFDHFWPENRRFCVAYRLVKKQSFSCSCRNYMQLKRFKEKFLSEQIFSCDFQKNVRGRVMPQYLAALHTATFSFFSFFTAVSCQKILENLYLFEV